MSASFEEFLDSSLKTFRDQLLQALTPTPALTAKTPKPSSQLLLPLPRREPHCHRSLDTEMLLPIRPRSPVEEPLVDPIPEAACEAETKMQPPEEDLMVAPLDSSGSSRGSRGKRRSRRPSVQDDEKAAFAATKGSRRPSIAESDLVLCLQEGLQGLQDLQGLEPDVTPDADDTMTLEAQGRLQVRLGALDTLKLITGEELHDTTVALGLTSYSIEDMNQMLNTLADYIDLKFVTMESPKGKHRLGRGASGLFKHSTPPGPPSWEWPRPLPTRRISTIGRGSIQILEPNSRWNAIPFRALVEAFQRDEQELSRKVFTAPRMMVQFQAVKEILLAGDTNRLVAELTFVRINDLAAPPEKIDVLAYLEPLVFLTILGNGIMIGVQSDPEYYDWKGWWWMELVFALVLVAEFLLRLAVQGCYTHFRGPDRIWNLFDLLFITTAIVDLVLELVAQDSSVAIATLLRFARMARITRIMKVFRLHWMKELRLMVKGLVGGFRTLVTAMILLLAVLYVIAGLATYTLGRDPLTEELGYRPLFYNLPISMFTAFRCLSGSCDADDGAPMNSVLAQNFGLSFVVPYVISYMLVTMGILARWF
ncbi:unnamed protein product [Durusdinium trenchii]|uniref:Ion transport domain-containing protein n=2 Tax=Durusdinium trenchii TaxID=1381693 RepID=A0ABP0R8H8_9DINO